MTNTRWFVLTLAVALAQVTYCVADQPTRIDIPPSPPDATPSDAPDTPYLHDAGPATSAPAPEALPDGNAAMKEWKAYSNSTIGFKTRVKAAWTMSEYKDAKSSSFASFTISHPPANLVTFSVNRDPLDRPFDEWTSTTSLSQLYPSGFKKSKVVFAGRDAVVIQGIVSDGRLDQSYFTKDGKTVCQVSFTAPQNAWNDEKSVFDDLKNNFRWLR